MERVVTGMTSAATEAVIVEAEPEVVMAAGKVVAAMVEATEVATDAVTADGGCGARRR